ncbi:hypothetical protein [Pseudomonas sp. 34 E 7]|uniref:hypothetical protein n=1 Tax=Pseudomonas sp. 34 E 7 TaxID=1844102 RepID=UPI000811D49F|nr:hypothetical protein [Pseudomonas sp. 34 E 7]CRM99597.1 hypothetical protein [Pseudomonas sp. 34 E 7]
MAIEMDDVTQAAVAALKFVNSPTSFLLSAFEQTVRERPDSDKVEVLREETVKRELEMRMAEAEARVAQELAIARRIETADEVEMTEFFEYAGEGHAGMKVSESSVSVGVSGSGRRINKRKFVFKGGAINYETTSNPDR